MLCTFPLRSHLCSIKNGVVLPRQFGLEPVGSLTYTPWGQMSVHFAATEERYRPRNIDWPPKVEDADEDWLKVGRYTLSYSEPFRLNESAPFNEQGGQIMHGPIMVASVPKLSDRFRRGTSKFMSSIMVHICICGFTRTPLRSKCGGRN